MPKLSKLITSYYHTAKNCILYKKINFAFSRVLTRAFISETVQEMFSKKRVPKFQKIYKETPVSEPLFNKVLINFIKKRDVNDVFL